MDNLNAHKNKKVRELIEATGASILFLPQAIYRASQKVSTNDVLGWFRYCGYGAGQRP